MCYIAMIAYVFSKRGVEMMARKERDKIHYVEVGPVHVNIRFFCVIAVTIIEIFTLERVLNKVI